jgi:hypothetical protein
MAMALDAIVEGEETVFSTARSYSVIAPPKV